MILACDGNPYYPYIYSITTREKRKGVWQGGKCDRAGAWRHPVYGSGLLVSEWVHPVSAIRTMYIMPYDEIELRNVSARYQSLFY